MLSSTRSPFSVAILLILFLSYCTASSSKYDDRRFSEIGKGSQASPGLYFDPDSGTFRNTPPEAPLVRSLDLDFLNAQSARSRATASPKLSSRGSSLNRESTRGRTRVVDSSEESDIEAQPLIYQTPRSPSESSVTTSSRTRINYARARATSSSNDDDKDSETSASSQYHNAPGPQYAPARCSSSRIIDPSP